MEGEADRSDGPTVSDDRAWSASRETAAQVPAEEGAPVRRLDLPPIPAKVLVEYVYCPRAGYLEWVESDFRENAFTLDGARVHRRVDETHRRTKDVSGDAAGGEEGGQGRVVELTHLWLSSERLGLTAVLDLVEVLGRQARPVEFRRHRYLDPDGEPPMDDKVQLCVQGLLLEEEGYEVSEGVLYFADVRRRQTVALDEELRAFTLAKADELRATAQAGRPPPPLVDSPKCRGCSLVDICLPDEVNLLTGRQEEVRRRLIAPQDEAKTLYLTTPGTKLRRSHSSLKVTDRDGNVLLEVGASSVSHVALFGGVQTTTQALRLLASEGASVTYMTRGGWLYGVFSGPPHKNVELRIQQFRAADHPAVSLALARIFVRTKLLNCRTMLLRNADPRPEDAIQDLKRWADRASRAEDLETLLGVEGMGTRAYFSAFATMLRPPDGPPTMPEHATSCSDPTGHLGPGSSDGSALASGPGARSAGHETAPGDKSHRTTAPGASLDDRSASAMGPSPSAEGPTGLLMGRATEFTFDFRSRNRRPPRDPVNALLSYSYALLLREVLARLIAVGFDPYRGFYHQPKYGRPALALDLMEEFRPIVADSVVINVINNGILRPKDFVRLGRACNLTDRAKKKVLEAFARRMDTEIVHPLFKYRASYRRIIELQARLLARYLLGDMEEYLGFRTR